MHRVTINIDMDRKCTKCRKGGATQNGLCLTCINKAIRSGGYDHILKKAKERIEARGKNDATA